MKGTSISRSHLIVAYKTLYWYKVDRKGKERRRRRAGKSLYLVCIGVVG